MNTTGRLIPYMRKSSGEDPEGSLARQRGAIRAWAETNGIELAPEVWEPNVSGKTPWQKRGLGEAIERVARGEASGIIVEEQSRLSRENMKATAEVWDALESTDARLVCTAEGIDTASGDHELRFAIQAALAREQWKQYARRMADMKARKIAAGIFIGPSPTGYRKGADRRLEIDPEVAPVVHELFELRANGASWGDLLKVVDGRTGRRWTQQGIAGIIRNRVYLGELIYGELVNENAHEAVVDAPLWLAAQRKGKAPARPGPKSDRWLLSGLLTCETCRHSMIVWQGSSHRTINGRRVKQALSRRYLCKNRNCRARASVKAPLLERFVTLHAFATGDEVETHEQAPDTTPLLEAVTTTQRRLEQASTPESQDALGDGWASYVKERRTEHEDALAALGEARAASPNGIRAFRLRNVWDDLPPADRRDALALFWREVRVAPKDEAGSILVSLVARGPGGETSLEIR